MLVPEKKNRQPKTAGRVVMPEDEEKTEKEENLWARSPGNDDGPAHGFEHCSNVDSFLA